MRASGLEFTRFYGVGNTTVGSQPDSAYRVRQTQLLVAPRVAIPLTSRLRFTVGPLLKYTHTPRSEEHTSELQSHSDLVCRLLLEKKKCWRKCQNYSPTQ